MFLAPSGANYQRAAFTLLELLAVVALLDLLSGLLLGAARRIGEVGRIAQAKAELAVLAAALENYQRLYGDYPQTDDPAQLLQSLLGRLGPRNNVSSTRSWLTLARYRTALSRDPLVDSSATLIDPWDQPYRYIYKVPAASWGNVSYVLYSLGPDGQDIRALLAGGFADSKLPENLDNLYANRP